MARYTFTVLFMCMVLVLPAMAEDRPAPCSAEEYRQFDFWIGDWEVATKDGKVIGHNRIRSILGGCVLEENWESANGKSKGTSNNIYDARRKVWHQSWVDNSGLLLQIEGAFHDGSMVLEGVLGTADKEQPQRITWTLLPDGKVRQLWEQETDGKYKVVFEGFYGKVKK